MLFNASYGIRNKSNTYNPTAMYNTFLILVYTAAYVRCFDCGENHKRLSTNAQAKKWNK